MDQISVKIVNKNWYSGGKTQNWNMEATKTINGIPQTTYKTVGNRCSVIHDREAGA
jgi:hypothetical protein